MSKCTCGKDHVAVAFLCGTTAIAEVKKLARKNDLVHNTIHSFGGVDDFAQLAQYVLDYEPIMIVIPADLEEETKKALSAAGISDDSMPAIHLVRDGGKNGIYDDLEKELAEIKVSA